MNAVAERPVNSECWPAISVVGPSPPPSGGMANQCEQLVRLLRADGLDVQLVRTNAPYRPAWLATCRCCAPALHIAVSVAALAGCWTGGSDACLGKLRLGLASVGGARAVDRSPA